MTIRKYGTHWEAWFWAGGVHYLLCLAGLFWTEVTGSVSPVWPAAGVALFAVARYGNKALLPLLLSKAAAMTATEISTIGLLATSIADPLKAAVAVYTLQRLGALWEPPFNVGRLLRFALGCLLLGATGASIGFLGYLVQGPHAAPDTLWFNWIAGDAAGALIVAPLLFGGLRLLRRAVCDLRWLGQALAAIAAVFGGCWLVYSQPGMAYHAAIFILPVSGWLSLRLRLDGAVLMNMAMLLAGVLAWESQGNDTLVLMLLTATIAVANLLFASLAEERDAQVQQQRDELAATAARNHSLQQQDDNLHRLLDTLPGAVAVIGQDAVLLSNAGAASLEEHLGMAGDRVAFWQDLAAQAAERGGNGPITINGRTGRNAIVRTSLTDFDWHGAPARLLTVQDVRERELMKAEIERSRDRFQLIFQESPLAMSITTRSGEYVDVNRAYEEMTGYTRAEALGKTRHTLGIFDRDEAQSLVNAVYEGWEQEDSLDLPENGWEARLTELMRKRRKAKALSNELAVIRNRAGGQVWLEFSVREIIWGDQPHFITISQDVTARRRAEIERRQMEDEIKASRDLLQRIFDLSPNAISVSVVGTGELLDVNRAFEEITGFSKAEVLGKSPDSLGLLPAALMKEIHSISPDRLELHFPKLATRTRDGREVFIELTLRQFENQGQAHFLAIGNDLTERLKTEAERRDWEARLRQSQKLEAIGTLAGGIAHDFNNVLTAIIGNAELAQMDLPPEHPVQDQLYNVLSASNRARDLISQILTFSRRKEEQRTMTDLAFVVKETARLLKSTAPAGISVSCEYPDTPAKVLGDPSQLHQVLVNLGTNGLQAMRGREGRLLFRTVVRHLGEDEAASRPSLTPGEYVCLTVSDTGSGIRPEHMPRLFEPFFTTKELGEGTGLGLPVVHGIVRAHGGAIFVESTVGVGSTFEVLLPAATETPGDTSLPHLAEVPIGSGQTVMVLDDETGVCAVVAAMLRRLNYAPVAYHDPKEAIEAFDTQPARFAAVLCDFSMPGTNGLQVADHILSRASVPFILMSGYLEPEHIRIGRELNVNNYLDKPVSLRALAETLDRLLKSEDPVTSPL